MAAVVTEKYRVANAVRNPLGLPSYCSATASPGEPAGNCRLKGGGEVVPAVELRSGPQSSSVSVK